MILVRRLARPMLAATFIDGGIDQIRNPGNKSVRADPVAPTLAARIPGLPQDPEVLVKINGATMATAGTLLALGKLPRVSALVLAATLVPTTLAGHAFWDAEDEGSRVQARSHFLKNLGMFGGLLLAAVDTEGRPGLAWRAQHAARGTRKAAKVAARSARREAALGRARLT
ncbi:DoxX family protein [Vallicoccus soli]|uniref:DoxX family protein n=1 Tax=Vallicoccus soli TaxID=2339232 RepID=A0A3A3ZMY3_9ACTN|nr:DoxX family protein [Vallicoccus soli]RJK98111.1 DoxX family protein [Vallicoccus soli]